MKKLSNLFHHEEEIIEVEEIVVDDSMEEEELHRKIEQAKAKVLEGGASKGRKKTSIPEPVIEEAVLKEHNEYKPIVPIIGEASRHSRDVDAKISYQYPKGQFRFPVISDKENQHKRKSVSREQERRRPKQTIKRNTMDKQEPEFQGGEQGPFFQQS
ncbi:hypothetical protein [Peribacillus deserti]|nr:hypothetical protein [Peribacillus deserti]